MDSQIVASFDIGPDDADTHWDVWCVGRRHDLPTRSSVRKAIRRGDLKLNGATVESCRWLKEGDTVTFHEDRRPLAKVYDRDLDVLFEDEHLAVVYKPAGIRVNGNEWKTLEHALPHNLEPSTLPGALRSPRIAHRLDRPTQGLVLCAKTAPALVGLNRAFQQREVQKTYVALLAGRLDGEGICTTAIDGRNAETHYRAMEHVHCLKVPDTWLTTVELRPVTGRKHQLRRHMAELDAPVLGDPQHTPEGMPVLQSKGLFLAAVGLILTHPILEAPISVTAPEPAKFGSMRRREARRWLNYFPETP
ncbi:MAG: RluA family pseudouridine synthase [Proteobacteria bacterium]|nr:RluA family pseudouridine synthase [Pseudomonadota bacterium]